MVIKLDGWEESQGVQDEIEMAEGLCLEIIYEDYECRINKIDRKMAEGKEASDG